MAQVGDGGVTLEWVLPEVEDPTITGWAYRAGTISGADTTWADWQNVGVVATTSHLVEGLINGTAYTFQVAAVNPAGRGPASEPSAAVTAAGPPDPPELTVAAGHERVRVRWSSGADNSSPIEQHEWRYKAGAAAWDPDWTVYETGEQIIRNLDNDTTYTFQMQSKNGVGYSEVVEVQATPRHPIEGPITISFTENSDAPVASYRFAPAELDQSLVAYRLHLSDVTGFDSGLFELNSGELRFRNAPDFETPADADGNNIYTVRLRAAPVSGNGGSIPRTEPPLPFTKQVEVTVTDADDPGVIELSPLTPQVGVPFTAELTDQDGGITGANWQWQGQAPGTTTWQTLSSTSSSGSSSSSSSSSPPPYPELSSYTPQVAQVGWALRAVVDPYRDVFGAGKRAESDPTAPVQAGVPTAPENLTPVASDQSVQLTWEAPTSDGGAAITGYTYRYRAGESAPWLPSRDGVTLDETTFYIRDTIGDLTNDTAYTFEVWANNAQGAGAVAQATATPRGPFTLTATARDTYVLLLWTAAPSRGKPIDSYAYRYRRDGGATWTAPREVWFRQWQADEPLSYTATGLTNGVRYMFEVYAYDSVGAVAVASASATPGAATTDVQVSYSTGAYQAEEGGAAVEVGVRLTEAARQAVSIPVTVTRDADTERGDYTVGGLTAGALSFAVGDRSQSFTILAHEDADRADETVELGLTLTGLPSWLGAGAPTTATVTLRDNDDDPAGRVSLSSSSPWVDSPLTATLMDDSGSIRSTTWQWERRLHGSSWQPAPGTSSSLYHTVSIYRPASSDRGYQLQATARYDDADDTGQTAASDPTDAVQVAPTDPATTDPAGRVSLSSSSPRVDDPLTASLMDDSGSIRSTTWQWERRLHGSPWQPAGGTSSSLYHTVSIYRPASSDRGYQLQATARYDDADDTDQTATSDPTDAVQAAPPQRRPIFSQDRVSYSVQAGSTFDETLPSAERADSYETSGTVPGYVEVNTTTRAMTIRPENTHIGDDEFIWRARNTHGSDDLTVNIMVTSLVETQYAYQISASGSNAPSFSAGASGIPTGWSSSRQTPVSTAPYEWRISRTRLTDGSWSHWGSATVVSTYPETQYLYQISASGSTAPSFMADAASERPTGWLPSRQTPVSAAPYEWRISRSRPAGGSWSNWGSATVVRTYTETEYAYQISASGSTAPSFSASSSGTPTGWSSSRQTPVSAAPYEWRISRTRPTGGSWSNWGGATVVRTYEAPPETQYAYRLNNSSSSAPSFSASASGRPTGWSSSRQTPTSSNRYEWRISRTRPSGGSWSNWGSATVVSTYTETQYAYRISASGSTAPSFSASSSGTPTGWSSSRQTPVSAAPYEWRISRTRPTGGSWSNWGGATVVRTYEAPPETQYAYRLNNSSSSAPSFSASSSGRPINWSSSRQTPTSSNRYEWRISRSRPSGGSWSNWGSATVVRTYTETQYAYQISASGSNAPSFSASASGRPTGWSSSRQTPVSAAPYEWRISRTRPTGGSWSNWGGATVVRTYEAPPETQYAYRLNNSSSSAPSFSASASGRPTGWSSSRQTPTSSNRYEWRISRTRPSGGSWSNWGGATVVSTYTETEYAYQISASGSNTPSFSASSSGTPTGWSSSRQTPVSAAPYEWRISRTRPTGGSWSNWGGATVVRTYEAPPETQYAYRLNNSSSSAPSFSASSSGRPTNWSSSRQTPTSSNRYEWRISRSRPSGGSWSNWGSATVVRTYTETQYAYQISASGSNAPSFSASASGRPTGWSSSRQTPVSAAPYEWRISRTRPTGGSWSNWGGATVVRTYEAPPETQYAYRLNNSSSSAPSFSASASGRPTGWSSSRQTPTSSNRYEWRISRTRPSGGSWSNWGGATVVRTYTETQYAYQISASGSNAPSFSASSSGIPTNWSSSRQTPIPMAPYEWRISRTRPTGGSWSNWGGATVVRTYTARQSAYRWNNSSSNPPTFSATTRGVPSGWSSSRQTPVSTVPYEWRVSRTRPTGGSWSNWGRG